MTGPRERLGRWVLERLSALGRANLFLLRLLGALGFLLRRPGLLVKQLYAVGVLSLPIIRINVAALPKFDRVLRSQLDANCALQ